MSWMALALAAGLSPAARAADNAASLDGVQDFLELGSMDPGSSFTVEAWVNLDSYTTWGSPTILEATSPITGFDSFYLGYVIGWWQIEINDLNEFEGDSCLTDPIDRLCYGYPATRRTNVHVAVSVTPTSVTLFLNGEEVSSAVTLAGPALAGTTWVMGQDTDNGRDFNTDGLDGRIDEVRIWRTARTEAEIQCLLDYSLTGEEPNLYAYWNMDEDAGAANVPDATGHGWDALVRGDTTFVPSPFGLTPVVPGDVPCLDWDGDGFTPASGDCDDTNPTVYPGAPELADGLDNDCDGEIEPIDSDGDGLLDSEEAIIGSDPFNPDTDGDRVWDGVEVGTDLSAPLDSDDDGTQDWGDTDDDGDGILTGIEETVEVTGDGAFDRDVDADGTPNALDLDSDSDGCLDADEGLIDGDGDGLADFVDFNADCAGTDTGDTGTDTGDTGTDTGADTGSDTGSDTGADSGDTGADTGADTADSGDTGSDTADSGDTGSDTADSGDTGADSADSGDTGADTGDSGTDRPGPDTAAPFDPDLLRFQGGGCSCATAPREGAATGWLGVAAGLVGLTAWRRRR